MTIQRAPRPTSGYILIRNEVARDTRLSYRARGVLISILSQPDNWTTTTERISTEGKEGRDAIRTAMAELEEIGYVERRLMQDSSGRWTTRTIVYDSCKTADFQPPMPGKPTTGKPTVGEPGAKEEQPRETTKTVDRFEEFYAAYPRKVGHGQAVINWRAAIKKADPQTIIDAAAEFAIQVSGREAHFIPHPGTWLSAERWADEGLVSANGLRPATW